MLGTDEGCHCSDPQNYPVRSQVADRGSPIVEVGRLWYEKPEHGS